MYLSVYRAVSTYKNGVRWLFVRRRNCLLIVAATSSALPGIISPPPQPHPKTMQPPCTVVAVPTHGFGNRMRMLSSAHAYASHHGCALQALWRTTLHMPTPWGELFATPLPSPDPNLVLRHGDQRYTIGELTASFLDSLRADDPDGCEPGPPAGHTADWIDQVLRPKPLAANPSTVAVCTPSLPTHISRSTRARSRAPFSSSAAMPSGPRASARPVASRMHQNQ